MSENERHEERDERAILAAIDLMDREPTDPTAEEMRPWVELLGLLPRQLEPVAPPIEIKQALMRDVGSRAATGNVRRFEAAREKAAPVRSPMHWVYRLAAVLAIALLGVSAKQAIDLAGSNRQLDEQADRIAALEETISELELPGGAPAWMASSGTELCELRPQLAAAKQSRGWLFVREDHQHWYIAVEGLAPSPEGQVYQLWFMADGKPVSGGTFEPGPDGRVSLTSESMPSGITGIAITLEPDDGDATPSDTTVLYGDEVMLTL